MQSSLKNFDYTEDQRHDSNRPVTEQRAKLRALPTGGSVLRLECRVPNQNYIRERFAVMTGNRRHDPQFKALRAENQRRQDLSIARGNVQLSRTSGDWHPITAAEIAAIKAAEEAAA